MSHWHEKKERKNVNSKVGPALEWPSGDAPDYNM